MTLPTSATMLSMNPLSCSTSALIALTSWDACMIPPVWIEPPGTACHSPAPGRSRLAALLDRNVLKSARPLIDLGGTVDPVGLQLLEPVGEPAGRPGDGEDRREQVAGDAELLVHDAAVEIDVRVDALGPDQLGHHLLELDRHIVERSRAEAREDLADQALQDGGARVLDLVDAVAEAG